MDMAMERYASGEESAFGELYDLLAPRLEGFLLRQTRDRARAEDLLQQTFLHLHRARGGFQRGAQVLPWAFAIARRLVVDGARRRQHEVSYADAQRGQPEAGGVVPDAVVEARRLARAVQQAVETLPEPQRAAFELVRVDGLSIAEAAAILGVSENAVKLRLHRASAALRPLAGEPGADLQDATP